MKGDFKWDPVHNTYESDNTVFASLYFVYYDIATPDGVEHHWKLYMHNNPFADTLQAEGQFDW